MISRKKGLGPSMSRGFTLVELLVVLSIISLLASISLAALQSAKDKAINSRKLSMINQYKRALELYYSTNGYYPYIPGSAVSACLGQSTCLGSNQSTAINSALSPTYIVGPPGNTDAVMISGVNFGGIGYRCLPTGTTDPAIACSNNSANSYVLFWVMKGINTNCAAGFSDQATNPIDLSGTSPYNSTLAGANTVCVYTPNRVLYDSVDGVGYSNN